MGQTLFLSRADNDQQGKMSDNFHFPIIKLQLNIH